MDKADSVADCKVKGWVEMRGVSPIVAVIVMVALAVTMGVMVSIWMTGWVSTQKGSEEFGCAARTRYLIESAKYTQSDSGLRFRLTNMGEEGLYGFDIMLFNGTNSETFAYNSPNITLSENISQSNKLEREESVYVVVNLSGGRNMGATLTEVRVKNMACGAVTAIADYVRQA